MATLHPINRESPELASWDVVSLVCCLQETGTQARGCGCVLVYHTHCPAGAPVLLFVQNIEIPLARQPLWSVGMGWGWGGDRDNTSGMNE